MPRFAIRVHFDGAGFAGTAVQPGQRTVQETLQKALSAIDSAPANCTAASRLDSGVSALAWVAHVDVNRAWKAEDLLAAFNGNLPADCRMNGVAAVADDWHARYAPHNKTYGYQIYLAEVALPHERTWWQRPWPSTGHESVAAFLRALVGYHDLTAFACRRDSDLSPDDEQPQRNHRHIEQAMLLPLSPRHGAPQLGQHYELIVTGEGFFYHQVRGLAGAVAALGREKLSLETACAAIDYGWMNKPPASIAPAAPLTLLNTVYQDELNWVTHK